MPLKDIFVAAMHAFVHLVFDFTEEKFTNYKIVCQGLLLNRTPGYGQRALRI